MQSVRTDQLPYTGFAITSCKNVGMRLEPRVFVAGKKQPLSVHEGPF